MLSRLEPNHPKVRVDKITEKLLAELTKDSRKSVSQITKNVRLSREATGKRIQKMGDVLGSYIPLIFLDDLGYTQIAIYFLLDEREQEKHDALIHELINHQNTVSLMQYNETWDLRWTIVVEDLEEYEQIMQNVKSRHPILAREKYAITRRYTYHTYPGAEKRERTSTTFSEKEIVVLDAVQHNCRMPSVEAAKKLNKSHETVLAHIRNLNKKVNWTAAWNLSALGYQWYTYALKFHNYDKKTENKMKVFAAENEHILTAVKCFGKWDVVLEVAVKDPSDCQTVLRSIKSLFAEQIRGYEAFHAYKEHVFKPIPGRILENYKKTE